MLVFKSNLGHNCRVICPRQFAMSESKQTFDEMGFVVERSFVSADEIKTILSRLKLIIEEQLRSLPREHVFYEDRKVAGSLKQIQQLQLHDEFFMQTMNGKPRQLAEELLGEPVEVINLQYFNKPAGIGKPTPAHQDVYYFKLSPCSAVTMWLALEDVDEENGCVRYLPRSHRCGIRPHKSTGTLGFSQGIEGYPSASELEQEIAIQATAGDLLAHHALTIHRADGNQSRCRSRQALGFIFYGVSAKVDQDAHQAYQQKLKSNLIAEGKI